MTKEITTREQYIESIKDMSLKEIALKYCKEHHLPRFLARIFVSFSYPLLIEKDKQLNEATEIIREYIRLANLEKEDTVAIWQLYHKAEAFINKE